MLMKVSTGLAGKLVKLWFWHKEIVQIQLLRSTISNLNWVVIVETTKREKYSYVLCLYQRFTNPFQFVKPSSIPLQQLWPFLKWLRRR